MKQTNKATFGWWLFTALKIFTAVVTGYDTWIVSQSAGYPLLVSALHVVVLDVAFLTFWWRAGELGESGKVLGDRGVNLLFACGMYALMLWVGWDAVSTEHLALALAVRSVGVLSLGRDAYMYLSALRAFNDAATEHKLRTVADQEMLALSRTETWVRWFALLALTPHAYVVVFERMRAALKHRALVDRSRAETQHRAELPARSQAVTQRTQAETAGDYVVNAEGLWYWECGVCDQRSTAKYRTQYDASKGYAGHTTSRKHTDNAQASALVSVSAEIIEVSDL